jgi:histone H1/5
VLFDHGGAVLRTGDPSWLARDPGWIPVLERVAEHPLVGAIACDLLPKGNEAKKRGLAVQKRLASERAAAKKLAAEEKKRAAEEKKLAAAARKEAAAARKQAGARPKKA